MAINPEWPGGLKIPTDATNNTASKTHKLIKNVEGKLNSKVQQLEKKVDDMQMELADMNSNINNIIKKITQKKNQM